MFKASVQDARLILRRPLGYWFRAVLVSGWVEERLTVELPVEPANSTLVFLVRRAQKERKVSVRAFYGLIGDKDAHLQRSPSR